MKVAITSFQVSERGEDAHARSAAEREVRVTVSTDEPTIGKRFRWRQWF